MTVPTNQDDFIDSRDIIEQIEELTELIAGEIANDELMKYSQELDSLLSLAMQGECYSKDWLHGVTLIHKNYFKTYMDDMIKDCYELPKNLPSFMTIIYDYDLLQADYTEIDFNGETYYIR